MTELHAVAATFEAAADSINHRIGYNLFDERRADVDQIIAELHSYAASLRAAVLVDPLPPVGQLGEITEALNSSERDTAVTLIRTNYTQVRESDGICTLLTHHADKSVRVPSSTA